MEPIRRTILDSLGARCSACGYDRWPDVLTVEADKPAGEFKYRLRYLEYCLTHLDRCRVLCMNCKTHATNEKRDGARQGSAAPRERWYVWVPDGWMRGVKYLNLERVLKLGYRVAIYSDQTQEVYEYPSGEPLATSWTNFAVSQGISTDTPRESFFINGA